MRALMPVMVAAVIAAAVVLVVAMRSRVERARHARRLIARHEQFLDGLRRRALTAAVVDPTSAALADEIAEYLADNTKEIR